MPTDTTEKGLESLIMRHMTGVDGLSSGPQDVASDEAALDYRGSGWYAGHAASFDREYAVDVQHLFSFLLATQPDEFRKLGISDYRDKQGMARRKFLARLQGEIARRGVVDVLRHGIKYGALSFDLFYGTPSPENTKAVARHRANRFSIIRQLRYSREATKRALDLCAFINGLPIATFELKNSLTKQTVEDAVEQYKRDRDPRETLFEFGRCVVHFAVDDHEVAMCTALKGAKGMAKDFLATILSYGVQDWEKLSIFLNFLISKLPAPVEEDLAKGILEAIDMDSYRAEKKATLAIALPDADAEIEPVPTAGGGRKGEPEFDRLSNILKAFNDQFGGLFADAKRMEQRIIDEIPKRVAADRAYQNAKQNSDRQNARIEHDKALKRVITALFADDAQLFKQFQDNESFRHWLTDTIFELTYVESANRLMFETEDA